MNLYSVAGSSPVTLTVRMPVSFCTAVDVFPLSKLVAVIRYFVKGGLPMNTGVSQDITAHVPPMLLTDTFLGSNGATGKRVKSVCINHTVGN